LQFPTILSTVFCDHAPMIRWCLDCHPGSIERVNSCLGGGFRMNECSSWMIRLTHRNQACFQKTPRFPVSGDKFPSQRHQDAGGTWGDPWGGGMHSPVNAGSLIPSLAEKRQQKWFRFEDDLMKPSQVDREIQVYFSLWISCYSSS
jgi:hypothetical protein